MHSHSFSSVKELEAAESSFRPQSPSSLSAKKTEVAELESSEAHFTKQRRKEDYKNLGRAVQFSLSFLVLFSAWNTCQNLTSTVMEDDGLGSFGYYILATLNFTTFFSAFTSTATIKKMGLYTSFFVASMCHFTFVLASILPAYRFNYPDGN